jgi:hypothetical protein
MEAIKACGWYHDFLEIILLLIRKLLEHESLMVKLMSSLRKFYDPLSFFDFRFLITALVSYDHENPVYNAIDEAR